MIDLGRHAFGPGAAVESRTPEIEIEAAFGDESDIVAVGNDAIIGRGTLGTGTGLQPSLGPMLIDDDGDDPVLRGGAGNDVIRGGLGNDGLDGQDGNDTLDGGPGDDAISGGNGNDTLVGGPGHDTPNGSARDDMISADDGEADTMLGGGPGTDTACYDGALDPPVTVESKFPA